MDSILVVCYSYSGTSRRAAQLLSSQHGWPLGEIFDPAPRTTLRCVLDSLLRRRPHVVYEGPPPEDFRTVVLVAPIWMNRLAGPMRSFIAKCRDQLPRVAFVAIQGRAGSTRAYAEIAHLLGRAPIASTAFLQREIEDGSGTDRLLAFGDAVQPPSTAAQSLQPAWGAAQAPAGGGTGRSFPSGSW